MIEACRDDPVVEAWIVCDHRAIRRFGLGALGPAPMRITPFLRLGLHQASAKRCGSSRRLAASTRHGLERTIAAFNRRPRRGEDPEFHRGSDAYQRFNGAPGHTPNPCIAPLDTPPFYAVRVVPSELGTFAGIATNANAQVVDGDGRPIAGLYAVGNDAASVMGGTYPGAGITIGPAHDLRLHRRLATWPASLPSSGCRRKQGVTARVTVFAENASGRGAFACGAARPLFSILS